MVFAFDGGAARMNLPAQLEWELRGDEVVTWFGRPLPFRYAIKKGWVPFLLGVLWNLALWNTASREALNLEGFFLLHDFDNMPGILSYPMTAVGVFLVTSPLWQYWHALRVCYAVTNQRALILNRRLWGGTESFSPADIGPRIFRWSGKDRGSLLFYFFYDPYDEAAERLYVGFEEISNVREADHFLAVLKKEK